VTHWRDPNCFQDIKKKQREELCHVMPMTRLKGHNTEKDNDDDEFKEIHNAEKKEVVITF
jgi:hypothetical protein